MFNGQICRECPSTAGQVGQVLLGIAIVLALFFLQLRSCITSISEPTQQHSVALKILINATQLNAMIAHVKFDWPASITALGAAQSAFNFDSFIFNLNCSLSSNIFFSGCLLIAFVPTLTVTCFSGIYFILRYCKPGLFPVEKLFLACSVGITLSYMSVVTKTFSLFRCHEVSSINNLHAHGMQGPTAN